MLSFVLPDISLDKEPDATEIATALHESLKTFTSAAELDAQGNPPKEFDEKTLEELRQIDFSKVNVKCCPAESGHVVAFIW